MFFTLIFYLIVLILSLVMSLLLIFLGRQMLFATTMLHGPVFVPSADDKLSSMIKLACPKKGEKIIDLGSGDGKVIIELAKKGFEVEGVEINPILVRRSRKRIEKIGLEKLAKVENISFWDVDFSKYDLIFLYGTSYIMKKLEKKLRQELRPGARLVSNFFQFPSWQAEKEKNDVRVYRR